MRSKSGRSPSFFATGLFACTALAQACLAQSLPVARLFSVYPAGGQTGATLELTIAGLDLENATRLHFSDPAITAVAKTQPPALGQTGPQPVPGVFTVTIAPEARLGLCEVRAIGKYGVSNPRNFTVGSRPEAVEAEPNNTPDKATEVVLGATINGRSDAAADEDYLKFNAKAGQRVILDCAAYRIDSRMDATLVLYDATGKELARNRDTNRRDPLVDYVIPADGTYYVAVNDFLYAGGSEYFYRLTISADAYLDFVFPPAGQPGTTGNYTVYGRNLPGGTPSKVVSADGKPLETLSVSIALPADQTAESLELASVVEPEESAIDAVAYRLTTPAGLSNSVLLGFAAAPVVTEIEPNDQPQQAQTVTVPCELAGQFHPQTDRDWVSFEAKAGQVLWMEVISQRLGLSTDPYLLVQQVTKNEKGEEVLKDVVGVDDYLEDPPGPGRRGMSLYDMKTDDPAVRFVAPADGTYRVLIRNLSNYTSADPRLVYRLSIRPIKPDFRVVAKPRLLPFSPDPNQNPPTVWSPLLRRGGAELIDVLVFRHDGFDEPVHVSVEGLPAGVTCAPITIGAGQSVGSLVLSAAEDAPENMSMISITAKAKLGDTEVTRPARSATMVWGGALNAVTPRARLARNLAIAVSGVETAPFFIDSGKNTVLEMCKAGKVTLPIKLVRRGDFKGNVTLAPSPLPPNVKPAPITLEGAATDGNLEITLPGNVVPGEYSFSVLGTTQVNYARNPELVKENTDRKAAVDKIVAELAAAAKASVEAKAVAEKKAADMSTAMAKAQEAAQAAAKAAEEAAAKAKAAAEAQAAAQKAMAEAEAQMKQAAEAKAVAEKAAAEADAALKNATSVQQAVDKSVADATKQAAPKAVNLAAPSPTVTLKITPAPITLAPPAAGTLKAGAKLEVPVTINRLYGFADAVQVRVKVPGSAKGLKIAELTIPANESAGKLLVEAAADAAVGVHALPVQAAAKYNGQDLSVTENVNVTVEAAQ